MCEQNIEIENSENVVIVQVNSRENGKQVVEIKNSKGDNKDRVPDAIIKIRGKTYVIDYKYHKADRGDEWLKKH